MSYDYWGGSAVRLRDATNASVCVDPYLLWFFEQWSAATARQPKDPRRKQGEPFESLRVSLLVHFDPRVATQRGAPDPVALLPRLWPSHLHSTLRVPRHGQSPWLTVRPCVTDGEGLLEAIEALVSGDRGVLALEFCTQRDALETAQWRGDSARRTQGDPGLDERKRAWSAYGHYPPQVVRSNQPIGAPDGPFDNQKSGPCPLVCVIDDLCNFASARHSAGGQRLLVDVWHQGSDDYTTRRLDESAAWTSALSVDDFVLGPDGLPLPTSVSGALVGRRMAAQPQTAAWAEPSAYAHAKYLDPMLRFSHGSAVMDLVCGGIIHGRMTSCVPPPAVAFVQLPVPSVLDTAGGSLASHALDGMHHALERAQPGQTVIVNLSYGTHGGPHDGSSLWDLGLRELLDRYDGSDSVLNKTLHVVLPAGNGHRSRTHAHLHVGPSTPVRSLRWQVLPDDPGSNFLEIWFPNGIEAVVTVRSPLGTSMRVDGHGHASMKGLNASVYYPRRCPQSAHSTMALVALGPSAPRTPPLEILVNPVTSSLNSVPGVAASRRTGLAPCPHGVWTIEISAKAGVIDDFMFHAWVMRGDAAPNRRQARHGNAGRQSYLLDHDGEQVDPAATMNGIACLEHERLWVVGAMSRQDSALSIYSAAGPNRCSGHTGQQSWRMLGPDVVVAADESLNVRGLLVAGVPSGARVRVSGTSMAAAAFTRHLYEHLASGEAACTAALRSPDTSSRISPTGNPYVRDAQPATRGERNRLQS
jgi:hypothetical protein